MALPTEKVTISTFHGGMAPDVGEVVGSLPTTAETLLNVEIQKDGSIRLRPSLFELLPIQDDVNDNTDRGNAIDYTAINSNAFASFAGGAWKKSPTARTETTSSSTGSIVWAVGGAAWSNRVTPIFGADSYLWTNTNGTFVDSSNQTPADSSPFMIHAKNRILNQNSWHVIFNRHSLISAPTITFSSYSSGSITVQIKDAAGTPQNVTPVNKRHFSVGTFFNNRLWLSGHGSETSTVYISQVISTFPADAGKMYAEDPANIVATDGGTIQIAEAGEIRGLHPYLNGVAVLAEKGIWLISGPDGVFSANSFAVNRLSNLGVVGEDAWTVVNNQLFWATLDGVYTLSTDQGGEIKSQSITNGKISNRIRGISAFHKRASGMIYDPNNNRLYWFVNDDAIYGDDAVIQLAYEKSRNPIGQFLHGVHAFVIDLDVGGWQQWTLPHADGPHVGVSDFNFFTGTVADIEETVTVNGVEVQEDGVEVTSAVIGDFVEQEYLHLFLQTEATTSDLARYAVGIFEHTFNPADFDSTIDAEVLSHPFTFDNLSNKKKLHFLDTAMTRVESGVVDISTGEDINPGSLLATFGWDWFTPGESTHPKANFTSQLYHPHRWLQSLNNGGDPKKTVVHEKHKIRGRGTAVQVKLTNPDGKDFHLNGWQITVAGSRRR